MPTGVDISIQERADIIRLITVDNRSPQWIWINRFGSDTTRISLQTINRYRVILNLPNNDIRRIRFIDGPRSYLRTGRRQILSFAESSRLIGILQDVPNLNVRIATSRFNNNNNPVVNAPHHPPVSSATSYRTLHRANFTNQRAERRHMRQDYNEALSVMRAVARRPVEDFIAMDGMNANTESFANDRVWGPRGGTTTLPQIVIRGISFSVYAAYSSSGFVDWNIIQGTTNNEHIESFLRNSLSHYLQPNNVAFLDNATNQTTANVRIAINTIFNGQWIYNARYFPQLNPIERGFSNIRSYIRMSEHMNMEPIDLINEAFNFYSDSSEHGRRVARGNWSVFYNNRNRFLFNQ